MVDAMAKSPAGDKPGDLAQRLEDPAFREQIEQAIQNMPPEKAAELVAMLEESLRRRKIELFGYLGAALMLLVGMIGALYYYGSRQTGEFVGWIFLLPLALAGGIMWAVGRWARRGDAERRAQRARRAS